MNDDSNLPLLPAPPLTIQHSYAEVRRQLAHSGYDAEEARATARLLVDEVCTTRHAHLLSPERVLTNDEYAQLQAALARLLKGEPLPYVLGRAHFHGLTLRADGRGLIPRPETELLVELALSRLQDVPRSKVADLGTGSGAIALAVAHARPDATVWATDLMPEARALASENAQLLGLEGRVHIEAGAIDDWAAHLPRGAFDAVLSNPPYIATRDIATLQSQVRDYEPHTALVGGGDGLNPYRLIARQCGALLREGGFVACELGAGQFADVEEIFRTEGWSVEPALFDFAGIARVLCATRQADDKADSKSAEWESNPPSNTL